MLIELAVGDAYGAGFEYAPAEWVREHNDLSAYVRHPRHGIKPGCYTDDTQMSIAVAEAVVSGASWTPQLLAEQIVRAYWRDPREGYSRQFHAFLQTVTSGTEFLSRIRPHSERSGAAMRAGPVGVYRNTREVIERTRLQAALTHNTEGGIHAAVAAALMSHYFIHDLGLKYELPAFLNRHVPGDWHLPWRGKVGSRGMMSVRAAVTAVIEHDSMRALLKACMAYTGDVDTVAAIALATGAHSREIRQDLPVHLIAGLEDGPYGRRYLEALDRRLLALAG